MALRVDVVGILILLWLVVWTFGRKPEISLWEGVLVLEVELQ